VMAILQQADKSDQEKLVSLKELLDANTDLELIARLVLGRHWNAASEEQRQEYVGLFQQILMNTMAERLGDYNGQTFEVVGSSELNERDTAVQSRILRVGGAPPLRVDWRVRETAGDFAIIDVIAEGVSLVVSQRNEVGSVVERRGMAGLIEVMRERSTDGEAVL
jgi:phospholipid transport system substrate-binding protein